MSEQKDDIFKQAAEQSFKDIKISPLEEEEEEVNIAEVSTQDEMALEHTEKGDKWDNLSEYMNGAGATRLLTELKAMPSKDYVRNYLKLLEHFKPKLVRSEISPGDEEDRVINVNMMQKLPSGEIRTITINNNKNER